MKKVYVGVLCYSLLFMTSCQEEETTVPIRKNIEQAVFASGYMEQEHLYNVSAKAEGILTELHVSEGDFVQQYQLIGQLESDLQNNQLEDARVVFLDAVNDSSDESPTLQNLQVQIEQARTQLAFDQEIQERYMDLWKKNSVSKLEYEKTELQLQNAQSHLKSLQENYEGVKNDLDIQVKRSQVQVNTQQLKLNDYRLTTEEAGTVIEVFKKRGELVRKGETIAQIASGEYVIKLLIAEEDITKIDKGQHVAVNLNTYPNQPFPATVTQILPGFDETEQSYVVHAQFDTLPEILFSGTQLQANIQIGTLENVLVIPTAYVSGGQEIELANGEKRIISTGLRNEEWTVVHQGLSERDILKKPE